MQVGVRGATALQLFRASSAFSGGDPAPCPGFNAGARVYERRAPQSKLARNSQKDFLT